MSLNHTIRPYFFDGRVGVENEACDVLYYTSKILMRCGLEVLPPLLLTPVCPRLDSSNTIINIEWRSIPVLTYREQTAFGIMNLIDYWPDQFPGIQVHLDGYPINPNGWRDEFLHYDYIGAPWPEYFFDPKITKGHRYRVGNGGFCLRSSLFMTATKNLSKVLLSNEAFHFAPEHVKIDPDDKSKMWIPEDIVMCILFRELLEREYGIKYAPIELAARWSVEYPVPERLWLDDECFGFHDFRIGDRSSRYSIKRLSTLFLSS